LSATSLPRVRRDLALQVACRDEGSIPRYPVLTVHCPLSLLESTLMKSPVSVATKELTGSLSPLDSTLTKNRGVGGVMVNQKSDKEGGSSQSCVIEDSYLSS